MSNEYRRIKETTGKSRCRHWTTEQKLWLLQESFQAGETVSPAARCRSVTPNLLYRRRRFRLEGTAAAVELDESVVGASKVKKLEDPIRELAHAWPKDTGSPDPE